MEGEQIGLVAFMAQIPKLYRNRSQNMNSEFINVLCVDKSLFSKHQERAGKQTMGKAKQKLITVAEMHNTKTLHSKSLHGLAPKPHTCAHNTEIMCITGNLVRDTKKELRRQRKMQEGHTVND